MNNEEYLKFLKSLYFKNEYMAIGMKASKVENILTLDYTWIVSGAEHKLNTYLVSFVKNNILIDPDFNHLPFGKLVLGHLSEIHGKCIIKTL